MNADQIEMKDFFDRHGFKFLQVGSSHSADAQCQCKGNISSPDRNGEDWRSEMWQRVLDDWDSNCVDDKLQTLMKQGVPSTMRSQLWKKLLDVETLKASKIFNYKAQLTAVREQLVDLHLSEYGGSEMLSHLADLEKSGSVTNVKGHISTDCLRHIILDLDRSFPSNKKFLVGTGEGKEGRASLFRILATYARYNPKVGYCQGMSYIGGMLLMQLEETDAFWCFVSLMERQKYLRGYYSANMSRIQRHGAVFEHLLKSRFPRLSVHLENLGAQPLLYMTPWFLCLFTSLPCWDTVLAVWDLLLLDGVKAIFRVALAMMDQLEETLLNTKDFSNIMPKLLHPDCDRVCVLKFMPAVWTISVNEKELSELEVNQLNQEKKTSKKRDRRSMLDSPCVVEKVIKNKKQKTETGAPPSLFRKLVNMFTPKEQRVRLEVEEEENGRPEHKPKARRRLSNQKSGGTLSRSRRSIGTPRTNMAENLNQMSLISPCQDIKEQNLKFTDDTNTLQSRPQVRPLQVHNSPVLLSSSNRKRKQIQASHRRTTSSVHNHKGDTGQTPPNGAIIPHLGHV